jgi:exodeoxyribonuclease VII small subunit
LKVFRVEEINVTVVSKPTASPDGQQLANWEVIAEEGSFEDAMTSLEQIVQLLDSGSLPLEVSVRCFETGTRLTERCTALLEQARLRISTIEEGGLLVDQFDESSLDNDVELE